MNGTRNIEEDWAFLLGYPWEEARQLLQEGAINYKPCLTAAPNKKATWEGARVIALRFGEPLVVICAAEDWTIE